MDSTSLLVHLLAQNRMVYGLSFDYGQKHKIELLRLGANLQYVKDNGFEINWEMIDLSRLGSLFHSSLTNDDWQVPTGFYENENMKQTVVPNRNAIFASIAYGYALSIATRLDCEVSLCLGVHSGDHAIYPDCRPEFYDAIFHAFELGNWDAERVTCYLPYLNYDKCEILKDADRAIQEIGLDFDQVFKNTCTSYQPDELGRSSGLTGSDVERILAFHEFGKQDPIEYQQPWEVVVENALKLQREFQQKVS